MNNKQGFGFLMAVDAIFDDRAQVVGWPPIRSYRKNTLATTSKDNDEVDGKPGPGALYVKVSMDGAPYLRKVDLRNYSTYQELSSSLEKMFSGFTIGAYIVSAVPGHPWFDFDKSSVNIENLCMLPVDYNFYAFRSMWI